MREGPAKPTRVKLTPEELARRITAAYNTPDTPFAAIAGGTRRIAVDPADRRAQMQLLRFGTRYYSKVQTLVHELVRHFRPDVFVDVGSNYGECLFSLPFNADVPVLGFEANPRLLGYLERSRGYNDDLSVEIVGKAVGAGGDDATVSFFVNERWSGKSTAARSAVIAGMKEISVPVTSIDREFAARFPDARTVVMKIDVEGYEPQVIAGAAETIGRADPFACLLEFDTAFLDGKDAGAGAGARRFFDALAARFHVYLAARTVSVLGSYDELHAKASDRAGKLHCDLLLLKATDDRRSAFEQYFCGAATQRLAADLWGLNPG